MSGKILGRLPLATVAIVLALSLAVSCEQHGQEVRVVMFSFLENMGAEEFRVLGEEALEEEWGPDQAGFVHETFVGAGFNRPLPNDVRQALNMELRNFTPRNGDVFIAGVGRSQDGESGTSFVIALRITNAGNRRWEHFGVETWVSRGIWQWF